MKLNNTILIILLSSCPSLLAAESKSPPYGSKGEFEISTGISSAYTANSTDLKSYGISLLPYANHFLFDHFFLRYQTGFGYQYFGTYVPSSQFFIFPGIAIGYSFNISDHWALNISGGYLVFYSWELNKASYNLPGGSQYTAFHPEIKFLLTEKWLLSLLVDVRTNIHDLFIYSRATLSVATTTFLVASYRL